MSYRYSLASNKLPKLECPICHRKKHWQRYYNTETGKALADKYGRCDNEDKCGHEVSPYDDTEFTYGVPVQNRCSHRAERVIVKKNSIKTYIPNAVLNKLKREFLKNQFYLNLLDLISYAEAKIVVDTIFDLYSIGTIYGGHLKGACAFPYIDYNQRVHTIQVKRFDALNHSINPPNFIHPILKREYLKNNKVLPTWLIEYLKNNSFVSCYFGEHLLKQYPNNPVALVEAPKTAIYGALFFGLPKKSTDLIWLATFNKSSLTKEKCSVLEGRNVILFPDLSKDGDTFENWKSKSKKLEIEIPKVKFNVSAFLEFNASQSQKDKGLDLADFLIQLDWREFQKELNKDIPLRKPIQTKYIPTNEYVSTLHFENGLLMTKGYPAEWDIHAPYISVKCRELIEQIVKTPIMLKLIQTAELEF